MTTNEDFNYTFNSCIEIVPDSLAPDELMFINYLNRKYKGNLKSNVRNSLVTYVDFTGKAIHPVNFRQLTPKLKENICLQCLPENFLVQL